MIGHFVPVDRIRCVHYNISTTASPSQNRDSPRSSHFFILSTIPAAKFLFIVLCLQTSLSHSTHTRMSMISAQSRHPSLSSIVYSPSTMTIRCRGNIGWGESAGSFKAWSNVGNGIVGVSESRGRRNVCRKERYEGRLKVNAAPCTGMSVLVPHGRRKMGTNSTPMRLYWIIKSVQLTTGVMPSI
jgi:hypothetical protein